MNISKSIFNFTKFIYVNVISINFLIYELKHDNQLHICYNNFNKYNIKIIIKELIGDTNDIFNLKIYNSIFIDNISQINFEHLKISHALLKLGSSISR
jgi:hypothetical protein